MFPFSIRDSGNKRYISTSESQKGDKVTLVDFGGSSWKDLWIIESMFFAFNDLYNVWTAETFFRKKLNKEAAVEHFKFFVRRRRDLSHLLFIYIRFFRALNFVREPSIFLRGGYPHH